MNALPSPIQEENEPTMTKNSCGLSIATPWLIAVFFFMLPASIPAKMWSDFPTPTLPTRIPALRLRGGGADTVTGVTTDPDQADIGVEPKFISKMLQKQGQKTSKKEAGDGHRNGDYFKPPVPFDLVKGETKEEFAARLKTSFHMLDDDEFYFTFYERFWPQYKADKRLRAARRNEELAPHLQEVFDQDEATTSSWFVPYSNLTRSHLGDFPNASSFVQSRLPKSKFKNASDSAEHALWEACQRGAGDEEIFKLAGEVDDIDAVDPTESNWTAAHFAAERGHVTVVEVLAALQADMWVEDVHGRTPLDVAEANSNFQVADVLQDVFDVDAERAAERENPPVELECPRGASHFEKIFLY